MLEKIETNFFLFSDVLLAMNGDNPGSLCNAANLTLAMWSIYAVLHFVEPITGTWCQDQRAASGLMRSYAKWPTHTLMSIPHGQTRLIIIIVTFSFKT